MFVSKKKAFELEGLFWVTIFLIKIYKQASRSTLLPELQSLDERQ